MSKRNSIEIAQILDNNNVSGFQARLFVLCGLCLIMTGFDVQVLGYLAPSIIKDWQLAQAQMGPVLGAVPAGRGGFWKLVERAVVAKDPLQVRIRLRSEPRDDPPQHDRLLQVAEHREPFACFGAVCARCRGVLLRWQQRAQQAEHSRRTHRQLR